jgi:hypothetical protein
MDDRRDVGGHGTRDRAGRDASRERRLGRRAEQARLQAAADQVVAEAERIVRHSAQR